MSIFSRLFKKESAVGRAIAQQIGSGQAKMTPRRYDTLADEGYIKNAIAYRCVSLIAESCASVPWVVYRGDEPDEAHPLNQLLEKPNPESQISSLIESIVSHYILAGNAYVEKTESFTGEPLEIFSLRPDRMKKALRDNGTTEYFEHEVGGVRTKFDCDAITGKCSVYHLKHFHPLNDFYGLASVEPAAYAIDQHNFAGKHNAALMQNGATPSALLVHRQSTDVKTIDRAQKKFEEKYSGTKNAGKAMVLGGDWDLLKMGSTMKELDFNKGKLDLAREICTGFGVPHVLVVNGETTYNNLAESRLFLWEEKIIPILQHLERGLMRWIAEYYGVEYSIKMDLSEVSALSIKQERRKMSLVDLYTNGILNLNEVRTALGYEEIATVDAPPSDSDKSATLQKKSNEQVLKTISDEIDRPEIMATVYGLIKSEVDALVSKYGEEIVAEIGLRSVFEVNERVTRFAEQTTAQLIKNVNRTTKRLVREEVTDGFLQRETLDEIRSRITDVFQGDIASVRAQRIAETEVTKLTGFAGNESIEQSGLQQKEWLSTLDGSTRDTHSGLDGQRVGVEAKFRSSSGGEAKHPGAFGIAHEDINCRCAIAAVLPEKSLSPMEKKDLWNKREKQRQALDKNFMEVSRKMFRIQLDAILKRMEEVAENESQTFNDSV